MNAELIDGKKTSIKVHEQTKLEVAKLAKENNLTPGLAVVIVGEDPASKVYVNAKVKKCNELGIYSEKIVLDKNTTQEELLNVIEGLNKNDKINGILVQSPPPKHINESEIVANISPIKDVDCFHAENVGKMLLGEDGGFYPCTPNGIMVLLQEYGIDASGKHAVVIGRSNIVGKPMMALLMQKADGANATVTVCHSGTKNLEEYTRQADILIAAIGRPNFVTKDMVKQDAVVVDVGINRVEAPERERGYKLVGDVNFEEVAEVASKITPVPGGVGPMTIAMLMHNSVKACKMQNNINN